MKKTTIGFLVIVMVGIGALIFIFYWQNFRGITPVITPPPQDITTLIPSTKSQESSKGIPDLPLQLPPGFNISIFAKNLVDPRVLIKDPNGTLLTSVPSEGKIVALPDANNDGIVDNNITIIDGLKQPHGMAFRCPKPENTDTCELYIAENDNISRYLYDAKNFKAAFSKKIADLPSGGVHFTRTIVFNPTSPNNPLFVSVGSSCNVCNEQDDRRAKILRLDVDTGEIKPYATGLRNSVFMTFDPYFDQMYATEMGRDLLGDDIPPDEINLIHEGGNYGWPICYGQNIHDTDFDHNTYIRNPCMEPFETPAYVDLQAHSAPLGLAFFPTDDTVDDQKNLWPNQYRGNLLVAFHGSWNRSVPTGYKVVILTTNPDTSGHPLKFSKPEDFITGWLDKDGKTALGRPAGILMNPNATLYISDDKSGVIYLLSYKGQNNFSIHL